MTEIKITINANGIADDYDEKEITQNKLIEKDLADSQLTEKDLKRTLESLIAAVKEIKIQYPDEQTDVLVHYDNRLVSLKFEITYTDKSGSAQIIEEKTFFEQVAKHSSLSSLILEYCNVTDNGEEGTRVCTMDEYDQGPPAGTYAMLALVNQHKSWIPNYIEFLRTNDLDHEVEQMWDIKAIIDNYNWCKETCRLAIARTISCCGQGGKEQFNNLLNDGLADYLSSAENKKEFLHLIFQEFEEWKQVEFRLKEGSKKHYLGYVVDYAQHFDKILNEEEINDIKSFLLNKWYVYHKN